MTRPLQTPRRPRWTRSYRWSWRRCPRRPAPPRKARKKASTTTPTTTPCRAAVSCGSRWRVSTQPSKSFRGSWSPNFVWYAASPSCGRPAPTCARWRRWSRRMADSFEISARRSCAPAWFRCQSCSNEFRCWSGASVGRRARKRDWRSTRARQSWTRRSPRRSSRPSFTSSATRSIMRSRRRTSGAQPENRRSVSSAWRASSDRTTSWSSSSPTTAEASTRVPSPSEPA